MSRRFCRLPQGFSESCALDCERRHSHMNTREVREAVDAGDVIFFDLHPITLLPRYIERSHGVQKTHISAAVIQNAAGAHRGKSGKYHWAGAGVKESAAREKVLAYGADNREFSSLIGHDRLVELHNFKWTDGGIEAGFPADGTKLPTRNLVRVRLRSRTPDGLEVAISYWRFLTMRSKTMRALAKSVFRKQAAALERLDRAWPEIVADFFAGPHSADLKALRASELPSLLLMEILRAYLQAAPTDRWLDVGLNSGGADEF